MGLNWGVYGAKTGPIIGMEVVTAFFVEAGFIGVLLYLGDGVAGHELPYQLSKLEAIEGNWDNGDTGFVLFSVPDRTS